jgi:L-cysteine S-thiosulfotransferase
MKKSLFLVGSISLALAGCATVYSNADYEKMAAEAIEKSFTAKGIAAKDRIKQDSVNLECTRAELVAGDLTPEVRKRIESENMRTIKYPADGNFMGDWKAGERLAQSGRGSTYSDKAGDPNGGNCYNCHQISKEEISHGTLGPTLYQFGKLRGNSEAVLKYTWGKLYNAKAYNACTNMPRFGHQNILTEAQMKDLMALLLDPNSPVNK